MKIKKFVEIFIVLTFLASVILSNVNALGSAQKPSTYVVIKYYVMGDPPQNDQVQKAQEEWNKILKQTINTGMEIKFIGWADWYTKYNLLLASGEPLDLVYTSSTWLNMWGNAQKGAFKELDDLLPKYAPKLWKQVKPEEWDQVRYKGKIIAVPENLFTHYVNNGFAYRGDWAKKFGIKLPIKDWYTFGKYLEGIKKNLPGVIPYDVTGNSSKASELFSGWVISNTDAVELPIDTGGHKLFWGKSYKDKYTLYSPVFDKTFEEYAKLMKQWASKGFWREDVLNFKGDTTQLLYEGKTGAERAHPDSFSGLRQEMDKRQPGSDLQFFAFSDTRNNLVKQPITQDAIAVGRYSKYPDRALMVLEQIRTNQKVYRLLHYGREGINYWIKDGKYYTPPNFDSNKYGFWTNAWGTRIDAFVLPSINEWEGLKDYYARYNKIAKPYPYGRLVLDLKSIQPQIAALSNVTSTLGTAISFGKVNDPVKAVEEYRAKLKRAGYDKVFKEIQRQLLEFRKLETSK